MKTIIITLLCTTILYSCNDNNVIQDKDVYNVKLGRYGNEFKVVIIDSCEYIYTNEGNGGQCITHKGNCKFCIKRNNK